MDTDFSSLICIANPKDRELFHEVQRPTGADWSQPSGSSYWLAALPPCVHLWFYSGFFADTDPFERVKADVTKCVY
jgi:hypothetical protein